MRTTTTYFKSKLTTTEKFIGESLEDKVRRVTETNAPIEAVSPMYYNERKDGVQPGTNIRTDKFDIALKAMDSIATGIRQKRNEKIQEEANKTLQSDKPNTTN